MAASDYTSIVQELYMSYFGRPADPRGLQNFSAQLDALGAPTNAPDLLAALISPAGENTALKTFINNAFSTSAEAKALYNNADNLAFVGQIYQNVLNRVGDADGMLYWADKLDKGEVSRENAALAILDGALHNETAQGLADKALVEAKVAVATSFTEVVASDGANLLAYVGDDAAAAARAMLQEVTSTTTVTSFQSTIEETIGDLVSGTTEGTTFNLTTGTDIWTGTAHDDTIYASTGLSADGSTAIKTTNALDKIDGGAGMDTLNVENTGGVNSLPGNVTNVEVVNLIGAGNVNGGADISAGSFETINLVDTDDTAVTVAGIGAQTIGLNNVADTTVVTANYKASQTSATITATGLPGAATVAVTGSGLTAVTVNVDGTSDTLSVTNAGNTLTSATINASDDSEVSIGSNKLAAVTITGAGAVDLTASVDLKTLTATDNTGGVTFDNTGSATNKLVAKTGAGDDSLTLVGAQLTSAATGAGDDTVDVVTSALGATASVDLGDGDDTLNMSAAPTAGATLAGGAGTDTLGMALAAYTTVAGFSSTNLGKITGFEVLSITDAPLADTSTLTLGKIAGIASAQIMGVVDGGSAEVTNVGANSSLIIAGDMTTGNDDGALVVTLKDATGASDVLNVTLDQAITQNNDGTADVYTSVVDRITANGVETINITSTGTPSAKVTAGAKVDSALNTINLIADAVETVNIKGDQAFTYTVDAGSEALTKVDASANTAGGTVDATDAADSVTLLGSATAGSTLVGSAAGDIITGGAAADTITGAAGGDTLTGGAGNDTFVYASGDSRIGSGTFDTIADFAANTYGSGTNGAAGTHAGTSTKWTGDVLAFTHAATGTAVAANGFKVFVASNAADATTFLANTASADNTQASAALDSAGHNLYVDVSGDGVADFYIHLTGVSSITAAAFTLA